MRMSASEIQPQDSGNLLATIRFVFDDEGDASGASAFDAVEGRKQPVAASGSSAASQTHIIGSAKPHQVLSLDGRPPAHKDSQPRQ